MDSVATFSYRADSAFIRLVARSQVPSATRRLGVALVALAVICAWALATGRYVTAILAGAGFVAGSVLAARQQRPSREVVGALRAQFAALPAPREIQVRVDDDGMHMSNALGAQEVPWAQVASVHGTAKLWWIHMAGGSSLPIPAAAVPPGAVAIMRRRVGTITEDA